MAETNRDRQREATRQRLYEAALGIFRRDGFREARVDDITLVAGVSRTAFYFHFPTKEGVLTELLRRTESPIAERVRELSPATDFGSVLDAVAAGMDAVWSDHRPILVDAMGIGLRVTAAFPKQPLSLRSSLTERFERAVLDGLLTDVQPASQLADLYLLNCMSAVAGWAQSDEGSLLESLRTANRLFLNGARRSFPA